MDVKDLAAWLGERLDKLESKVDTLTVNSTKNTADLEHHISRTDALETRVEQVAGDMRPLQDGAQRLRGALALGGAIAGATAFVIELLHQLLR